MKLLNSQRDQIINLAINATFEKREKELTKLEDVLARKAYSHVYDASLRRKVNAVPVPWFRRDSCLRFNVGGQQHVLNLANGEVLPTPYSNHCNLIGVLDGEVGEEVRAFSNDKQQARDDKNEATAKLRSLLYSISTLKRLKELWPEGKKFYKSLDEGEIKGGLPALRFDDVNALLGIAK